MPSSAALAGLDERERLEAAPEDRLEPRLLVLHALGRASRPSRSKPAASAPTCASRRVASASIVRACATRSASSPRAEPGTASGMPRKTRSTSASRSGSAAAGGDSLRQRVARRLQRRDRAVGALAELGAVGGGGDRAAVLVEVGRVERARVSTACAERGVQLEELAQAEVGRRERGGALAAEPHRVPAGPRRRAPRSTTCSSSRSRSEGRSGEADAERYSASRLPMPSTSSRTGSLTRTTLPAASTSSARVRTRLRRADHLREPRLELRLRGPPRVADAGRRGRCRPAEQRDHPVRQRRPRPGRLARTAAPAAGSRRGRSRRRSPPRGSGCRARAGRRPRR